MSVFQLGSVIRNRREELGFSQEDLADGICSVPTLSRIENGERMPTKNHFEMLMQRLGYSAMSLDYFTDKRDFLIYELKIKIRNVYVEQDYSLARKYLGELRGLLKDTDAVDTQFISLYDILLNQQELPVEERLEQFEKALRLTCPSYQGSRIPKVLSYEEIILLNNIAICYGVKEQRDRAIDILYALKNYYERQVISADEALRTQPMILYNLSKVLGLEGRYDECIEVCNQGIRIARRAGRCQVLGKTLFNHAWAHLQRDQIGDREIAKHSFKQAYCFAFAMGNSKEMEVFERFYVDTFSEDILY